MDFYFYSARPLCIFLFCAKLQPLLHSSVFIPFIAIDQCVYYIYFYYRGFYFNSY